MNNSNKGPKTMKTHHCLKTITMSLVLALACHAQDATKDDTAKGDTTKNDAASFLDSSPEALGAITNQAKASAEDYIAKRGWSLGLNPDGKFVAVGIAPISAKPTDYQFATMRVNAYTKAMLDAKASIARFVATEIKTEVLHNYGTTSELRKQREEAVAAQGRKNAGILEKVKMLINAKLDNSLKAEGVVLDSPQAAEQAGKLLNQDSFNLLIESSAQAFVSGLVCNKIFEEDGQMAVVAYYSDNSRIMADAIAGKGNAPKVTPRQGDPLPKWVASLTPKQQLYPSFGVQLTSDSDGNIVILSYGQAVAQTPSGNSIRNAEESASTMADGYIRQFAGEMVSYNNVLEKLEKTEEFDTGIVNSIAEDFQDTAIKAKADGLKISGIQTIRTWDAKDTRSNKFICGVVRSWSLADATAAKELGHQMMDSPAAGPRSSPQGSTQQSGTYKIESPESEVF